MSLHANFRAKQILSDSNS